MLQINDSINTLSKGLRKAANVELTNAEVKGRGEADSEGTSDWSELLQRCLSQGTRIKVKVKVRYALRNPRPRELSLVALTLEQKFL